MKPSDWGTFGAFGLMLLGLSLFSPKIAATVGLGVAAVIVIQHPKFFLGAFPNAGQPN